MRPGPKKQVKFTRKVTSKTTVTTAPRPPGGPLKSCLKRTSSSPAQRQPSPQRQQQQQQQQQQQCTPWRPPNRPSLPPHIQVRPLERKARPAPRQILGKPTNPKLALLRSGKKKLAKPSISRFAVPAGEDGWIRPTRQTPPEPSPPPRQPSPPCAPPPAPVAAEPCGPPPRGPSPPPDFSKYRRFLENYAPYAGDYSDFDCPPAPPCSPEPEEEPEDLMYHGDVVKVPLDEGGPMYGPPGLAEELLDDPEFYPIAGSMVPGGFMDFMPRMDLPPPMVPEPYGGPVCGPENRPFPQIESTARHRMVGWDPEPQVRLYRPDLPPSSPYEPYTDLCGLEEDDLIGLHSPPIPSPTDLMALRYQPPPIDYPEEPFDYIGCNPPETMPWRLEGPPQQYSPTRFPIHYDDQPPPAIYPSHQVCDTSPDHDMGEASWFHEKALGYSTPYEHPGIWKEPSWKNQAPPPRQVCGAGDVRMVSPPWVPPHRRPEEPVCVEDDDAYERQFESRAQAHLDRQMQKYGVGKYREEELMKKMRHVYDPNSRLACAPEMDPGPSSWFETFHFPSPPTPPSRSPTPSPPSQQPICETPRPASVARGPAARRPVAGGSGGSGGRPPGPCRTGPAPSGAGSRAPPQRRQPPPVPTYKPKLKIDNLPAHLKGRGPTEMKQNQGPDQCEMNSKQAKLQAAKARMAAAKAYAAQQRGKRC